MIIRAIDKRCWLFLLSLFVSLSLSSTDSMVPFGDLYFICCVCAFGGCVADPKCLRGNSAKKKRARPQPSKFLLVPGSFMSRVRSLVLSRLKNRKLSLLQ